MADANAVPGGVFQGIVAETGGWRAETEAQKCFVRLGSDGSAWGPVILPVFKTGGCQACPGDGAFDSHTLPPYLE